MPKKNSIRILFLADTHLGFDYPIKPRVQRRRRGPDFFDNFQKVLSYAIENKVDLVIHGGDFFFRSRVPRKIVDMAYQMLFDFAESGIPIFIVPGNHERAILPASLFLLHPQIYIFNKPQTYSINISGARISIAGFPSERNQIRKRFISIIEETKIVSYLSDVKLLCMHQAVEGATVGPANFIFRNGQDVIRMQDLPVDCHAILSGHIHRRQVLKKRTNIHREIPVIYPGSIERTSFAEKSEEKGFYEIEFYQSDKKKWRLRQLIFKPLPARPMVDVIIQNDIARENLVSFLSTQLSKIDKDAIVRLKYKGQLNEQVKKILTGRFLRENFSNTLNFQFGAGFYSNYQAERDMMRRKNHRKINSFK